MLGLNHFGIVDYIVVGATLLLSLGVGIYYAIVGKSTNETLLVGGRSMSTLPVAASIMVSYMSAITIIGYPAEVYSFGVEIFMMCIVGSIFIPLSAIVFVPAFYSMKLTSVYEYLELRFESLVVRWLASALFIIQQLMLTGVVLYAPAIALDHFLGLPVWISVLGIGFCGTLYTSIGGLKAVVWTDAFQFLIIVVGLLAIVIRAFIKAGGIYEVFQIAQEHGRLELFNFTWDPFMRHNFWNFLFGYGMHAFLQPGTHQLQVQRYSSLPSQTKARRSIICSVPLKNLILSMCLITGLAIFATYAGCDPILLGKIKKPDEIVPLFVIEELLFIPGMMGLFTSCMFSAVLSSVSSALNSMAAVTWEDFLSKTKFAKQLGDFGQTNISRFASFFYGALCILLAMVSQNLGMLFTATMSIVGITSGTLGAVFVMGLFMPFVNKFGAIAGMIIGVSSMTFISVQSKLLGKSNIPLYTAITECPSDVVINSTLLMVSHPGVDDRVIEWPDKLYTISYMLYPFIGALVTILMGILVSGITGGFFRNHCTRVRQTMLLHPWLQGSQKWMRPVQGSLSHATSHKYVDRVASLHNVFTTSNPKLNEKRAKNYKYDAVPTSPHPEDSPL